MTPRSIDLDSYKDEIAHFLFCKKLILDVITYFKDSYNLRISRRILQRRLKIWQIIVRSQTKDTSVLRNRIIELFFYELNKIQLLRIFKEKDYQIGKYSLVRIRKELDLKRRLCTINEMIIVNELIIDSLTSKLEKNVIKEYNRELLYVYF